MTGTRISDMTSLAALGTSGDQIPVIRSGVNYRFDLAAEMATRLMRVSSRATFATLGTAHSYAYLTESGRQGVFVWSSTNLSAAVTADTAQGIYVPPSSDASGASGAWVREFSGAVEIEWFGGGTSVSDNTAALRALVSYIAYAGGGMLLLNEGTYNFASATLGGTGIELPANITIQGKGIGVTKCVNTGVTECYTFLSQGGKSNQLIRDLTWRGNSVANNSGPGGFYMATVKTAEATASASNCVIRDVRLENFKGDIWVDFIGTHATHTIHDCGVDGLEIRSETGNARGPSGLSVISYAVRLYASGGAVNDCFVKRLTGDFSFLKGAVALYGRVSRTYIGHPVLAAAFQGYSNADSGGYAILMYDLSTTDVVTDTSIVAPIITDPYTCGIYMAGTRETQIVAPQISGQEDTSDNTLPKAAIALNGCNNVTIHGPILHGNFCNIAISGPSDAAYDSDMNIAVIGGSGRGATGTGVKIKPSVHYALSGGIRFIVYRDIENTGSALELSPTATAGTNKALSNLRLIDCEWGATANAVDINKGAAASHGNDNIVFRGGRISAAGDRSITGSGTNVGRLVIDGVSFDASVDYHLVLTGSTNVQITYNKFIGAVISANMVVDGTQGELYGNVAVNGSTLVATSGTDLGKQIPAFTGKRGMRVQHADASVGEPMWFEHDGTAWRNMGYATLNGSETYNPGSLATGASTAIETVTVTGAALGDLAEATFSNDLAGVDLRAWVSAADTVSYYFTNTNGANPTDLASGTVRARVEKVA
jgi:hypothetical protein